MATFADRIAAFIADVKDKGADGYTLRELGDLLLDFVDLAVDEARALQVPGTQKKAYVMAAVGTLYDTVAPFIPLGPLALLRPFIRPIARQTVLVIADRLIERVLKRLDPPAQTQRLGF